MNLIGYTAVIVKGINITLMAWVISSFISLLIGGTLGILGSKQLTTPLRSKAIFMYTFITKGIPAYVHILIAYFVVPAITGISLPAFAAAVGGLAVCSSGYITEIVRSTINAVPQGQWDACFVLGYSLSSTLKRIIIPQALRIGLSSLSGEMEQLLKSSSLLATIGITELTRTGMNIISRELNPITVYCLIALIYLILSACLQMITFLIKKRGLYAQSN